MVFSVDPKDGMKPQSVQQIIAPGGSDRMRVSERGRICPLVLLVETPDMRHGKGKVT